VQHHRAAARSGPVCLDGFDSSPAGPLVQRDRRPFAIGDFEHEVEVMSDRPLFGMFQQSGPEAVTSGARCDEETADRRDPRHPSCGILHNHVAHDRLAGHGDPRPQHASRC
jgi:hypothetical protein